MMLEQIFKTLTNLFNSKGYSLYAVGGTVRDFLLNRDVKDYDFVTDAKPCEMLQFLDNYNDVFARFGVIIYKINNIKVEITTLRKENTYSDSRHPDSITFVKDLKEDYVRRDFTINALYMTLDGKIKDYCHGLEDLKNKTIRVIGDIDKRIKEDPLRILRALRFSLLLDFKLDDDLKKYIEKNNFLLHKINKAKIEQEIKKMVAYDKVKTIEILNKFNINYFNLDI